MLVIDAFSFGLSVLGVYSLILSLRYLLPCYTIPCLSARLNETRRLLSYAEEINAVPPENQYQAPLHRYANRLVEMRSQGRFQLLRLVVMRGLICRLYRLYYRIEGIRSELELAIDMQQLRIADSESATRTVVPSSSNPASATVVVPAPSIIANHPFGREATPPNVIVPTPSPASAVTMITSHPSATTAIPVNDVVYPTPALAATSS